MLETWRGEDVRVGRRISVVGTTGTGKSTLARAIARRLDLPYVELDALYWGPGWTAATEEVFRARVSAAAGGDAWVFDGNYGLARDIVWARADTIVWLDLPLPVMVWRLAKRTLRRIVRREVLWHENRETWRGTFLSRDSLFVWQLTTYRRRRREYTERFSRPEYAHLIKVRLTSPKAARNWLNGVGRSSGS